MLASYFSVPSTARFAKRFPPALRNGLQDWRSYIFGGGTFESEGEAQAAKGYV